jgi:DNA helicase-4
LNRLQKRPLSGLLTDPLGRSAQAMELDGDQLRVTRRGIVTSMPLEALTSPPEIRKGMLGTALTIKSGEHGDVTLKGARYLDTQAFSEAVRGAWVRFNLLALEKETDRLERLLAGVKALEAPSRYPAACRIAPLLDEARALDASLLSKLQPEAVGGEAYERIATVRKFVADPQKARADGIATFVTAELDRWKDFLDRIESNPLTPEQRLSVVVDEDATLVLAGAGSGKTSVITAKAAYLVKTGIRQPEEILLLAFAKNAAAEMAERVEARSGVPSCTSR